MLAESDTTAVLLPGTIFFLRKKTLVGLMEGDGEVSEARQEALQGRADYEEWRRTPPAHNSRASRVPPGGEGIANSGRRA